MNSNLSKQKGGLPGVRGLAVLGGFFVLLAVALNAMGVFSFAGKDATLVTYTLDGTASAVVVTYTQANGKATERFDTTLPWHKTIPFHEAFTVVLVAGNPSGTGSLSCEIRINGEVFDSQSVAAPRDRVACAGVTP